MEKCDRTGQPELYWPETCINPVENQGVPNNSFYELDRKELVSLTEINGKQVKTPFFLSY